MDERTTDLPRIAEAQALPGYKLRLRYQDGAAGVVDLAGAVASDGVFTALAGPRFSTFRLTQGGRAVCWLDDAGREVDLCADALRL